MIRDFDLTRTYGDPYNTEGRSLADTAQKHKVHHLPYLALAALLFGVFRGLYGLVGLPTDLALYSVNAAIVCLNLVLLAALLRRRGPAWQPRLPFLVLYAFALGTWIFASVPESWPFAGTLVLLFFLLLSAPSPSLVGLAALAGLFMVNNLMLGSLTGLLMLREWRESGFGLRGLATSFRHPAIALGVWLVVLTLLSVADPAFRPDHFLAFTAWFKSFIGVTLPPWDPYVWQSALSNLFVNSVVSSQPDPAVPQEALLSTLRGGLLGVVATLAWVAAAGLALYGAARVAWGLRRDSGSLLRAATDPAFEPLVYCGVMALVTVLLHFPSGFLYSAVVLPLVVATLHRFLDLRRRSHALVLGLAVLLVVVNNALQVAEFRSALAGLS